LGIVHGVMPAIGAGTAYKRMRCGFEGSGISTKILGGTGAQVTAVLANSQGGLELLPSKAYGNDWLKVKQGETVLKSLPKNGDTYEEIYKLNGKWLGLIKKEWINPARAKNSGFENTCGLLDNAKAFHTTIENTYHENSYAHYGVDKDRKAWQQVVWEVNGGSKTSDMDRLEIVEDDARGKLKLLDPTLPTAKNTSVQFLINLKDAAEPGDQTVPAHSADAQLRSNKFKGLFRQTGYEHQASYSNSSVLSSTLYCLFQIASTIKWSSQ